MAVAPLVRTHRVPDPVLSTNDAELRQHVQRVLSAHYEVEREIGRGGMGIVYLARDVRLKRPVAIKLLPPELAFRSEIRSRFLREAETAAQLSHPNIVPIFSVDEREGLVYFIMGYIAGGNLGMRLAERGRMDPENTRRILRETADALAYAHARGVVHRDIKPDNILLCADDDDRAVVTDFGIARAVSEGADSRLTATGMAIGTPTYMSPEQAAGERDIDGRSDLYSLGVVGYQMLTGVPPFSANSTPALLVKHLSEVPTPVSERVAGVPDDLARAVMLMLEKDPESRFPNAEALVTALEQRAIPAELDHAPTRRATAAAPAAAPPPPYLPAISEPTPDEMQRWDDQPVVDFRNKVGPYLIVNAAIILMSLFTGVDLVFVTAIWTVFMAYRYAKLRTDGYDWRDVFRQPKDRMMFDVAAETIDDAMALFDPQKRDHVRARERARRALITGVTGSPPGGGRGQAGRGLAGRGPAKGAGQPDAALHGEHAAQVRHAQNDRDEIARLVRTLDKRDRARIGDVQGSADALLTAIRGLAVSLTEAERNAAPGAAATIDAEIAQLEAQANPLDRAASEDRVRRLAYLKRQRRTLIDGEQRRQRDALRLDGCVVALQNLKLDLVRLTTGAQAHQQVTLLAERAMSLAHDVDGIVAADDLARVGTRDQGPGTRV
jgi:serine/threonine-protein kinase